ncbi:protein of unknown function [Burkholderia multivorans]
MGAKTRIVTDAQNPYITLGFPAYTVS